MAETSPNGRRAQRARKAASTPTYEFDAALSFAGEDRRYASRLAKALTSKGYRVFYDREFRGRLWGENQREYELIYGPKSRFVIPFVSEHYVHRDWPRFEFESARREAKNREGAFLLPVRLDDARLFGLNDDLNYLRLGELTIGEIASEFERRCGAPLGTAGGTEHRGETSDRVRGQRIAALLSSKLREALGLFVTSIVPLPLPNYRQVFPSIDWSAHSQRLLRVGLITTARNCVKVSPAAQACFCDRTELARLHKRWVDALLAVPPHIDTALFLALHYLQVGSIEEVINTLANVVEGTSLGDWNQIYLGALRTLATNIPNRHLPATTRRRLYNSLGICLSHAGEQEEALRWFARVGAGRASRADGWYGQSLLNLGVSYEKLHQPETAAAYYRKAISNGQQSGDGLLVARAKGNLAQLITSTSPNEASRLLADSITAKRHHRDDVGLAVAYAQLAKLKEKLGQKQTALKYQYAAKRIAQRFGMREALALIQHDLASTLSSLGKPGLALQYYRRARRLATEDGYLQTRILVGSSEGRLCFELGRYGDALAAFRDVLQASKDATDHLGQICSHHGIGVILRLRGRSQPGKRHLQDALRLARQAENEDWTGRCLVDSCRRKAQGRFIGFDTQALRRAAIKEQENRRWAVAGRLWMLFAEESRESASRRTTRDAFISALRCYARSPTLLEQQADALSRYYVWLWRNAERARAVEVLRKLTTVARAANRPDLSARAIDQLGVCLQDMGQPRLARSAHARALRISRRLGDPEQIARSLNNLGESLRKLGKYEDALPILDEAQETAIGCHDFECALSAAGNRALIFWSQKNEEHVGKTLHWCHRFAIRHRKWSQAVTALARLGELAWEQKRPRESERYYARALAAATKHRVPGHRIALSYARILLSRGNLPLAAKVLPQWRGDFIRERDSYLFHYTLGEIYQETRKLESAALEWRLGRTSAEAAGEKDYIALCASRLAEVLETQRQLGASVRELRVALRNEPEPEGKALLLVQMLRVQLANGGGTGAERSFVRARDIASRNGLHAAMVDVHVMIGDHYWLRSRRNRLGALKAYCVALIEALQVGIDKYSDLLAHTILSLTGPKAMPLPPEFARLFTRLEQWVSQSITSDQKAHEIILAPFAAVRRVLPFASDRERLAHELSRLAQTGELFPVQASTPVGNEP